MLLMLHIQCNFPCKKEMRWLTKIVRNFEINVHLPICDMHLLDWHHFYIATIVSSVVQHPHFPIRICRDLNFLSVGPSTSTTNIIIFTLRLHTNQFYFIFLCMFWGKSHWKYIWPSIGNWKAKALNEFRCDNCLFSSLLLTANIRQFVSASERKFEIQLKSIRP